MTYQIIETHFKNNLKLVYGKVEKSDFVKIYVCVKVGSINETKKESDNLIF